MKQFFCNVCGTEIELKAEKTYLASVDYGALSALMPSDTYRVINCPVCGCQNKLCGELPRETEDNEAAPELDSERASVPLLVPLTREQIEKMDGKRVVVIPKTSCYVGGFGKVDLGENIIDGCAPTEFLAWSLDMYGELFVAYRITDGASVTSEAGVGENE